MQIHAGDMKQKGRWLATGEQSVLVPRGQGLNTQVGQKMRLWNKQK